jgi:hypothetical protein
MRAGNHSDKVVWRTLVLLLLVVAFLPTDVFAEASTIARRRFAIHEEGLQWLGMRNNGELANPDYVSLHIPDLEYPGGSMTEFLYSGGLWVGAVKGGIPIVSTCTDGNNGTAEFGPLEFATDDYVSLDSLYSLGWLEKTTNPVTADDQAERKELGRYSGGVGRAYLGIGVRDVDDDGDGLIDEDPAGDMSRDYVDNDGDGASDGADSDYDGDAVVGSLDDDGDGLFDEDDSAVAGQELITVFVDTCETCVENADIDGFTPLGIRVRQHSYQWRETFADDFIIMDFEVTNINEETLHDVCVGTFFDFTIWNVTQHWAYEDDWTYYDETLAMAIGADDDFNDGLLSARYFGVRIIETSEASPPISFGSFSRLVEPHDPVDNAEKYAAMSSGDIDPDRFTPSDWRFLLAVGPLGDLDPGESMSVTFAVVNGVEEEDLLLHAKLAKNMWDNDFSGPTEPEPPEFSLSPNSRQVTIRWNSEAEQCVDRYTEKADFQGYNVWRTPDGEEWTLVQQYDQPDTIGLNEGWPPPPSSDEDFDYEIVDDGLMNGARLRYVVTAFDDGDNGDGIHTEEWDRLNSGMGVLESSRGEDVQQRAVPAAAVQAEGDIDNVYVVPNPYVGSSRLEQHGWSGGDGRIEFRGLPRECEIEIWTLAGDLVRELKHDSGLSWETWDVRNDEGDEVAGGIYVYRVSSGENEQIGKFFVVK